MNIRKARVSDLNRMLEIYSIAREYMKANGNANQWGDSYPDKRIIIKDIEDKISYVIEKNGVILACFAFIKGYENNYELEFTSDMEYGVIHRVASDGSVSGVARQIVSFAKEKSRILRIDTHKDNKTMQRAIESLGFNRLEIIYLDDGTQRILYELKEEI